MQRQNLWLLVALSLLLILLFAPSASAFGAGNIPSFAYLEGKAFRHGDIEDILESIKKGGGILGRSKFGGLDIKRVYFGNWLRDYSQAMDVAGLSKLSKQTIINLCMALGFLAHGYATGEFEVTEERLGVYLPVEHIDNPKGYNNDKDARPIHPKLRPPCDPRELEIDLRSGMKNYIANESGGWDTSTAHVRRTLEKCIEFGRRARSSKSSADEYEAYRLLGTALHTLEDFPAHSNWCEISLVRLGYRKVFCHVGDGVILQTPAGPAPPIVTGTFGSDDFIHSLLGEASDHLSQASVSDLNKAINNARSTTDRGGGSDSLRNLLFTLPGGVGNSSELTRGMAECENIRMRANTTDPANMSPQDLHATLWQVLTFRDNVVKTIENTIEKIPGLGPLVEKITEAVTKFVFVTLEPYLKPLLSTATSALQSGSSEVIDNVDQYTVFDNPLASDPTHSFLSKDHFNLILNEPAGNLAKIIVTHTVKLVVQAWENSGTNAHQTISTILEAIHHPYFLNERSSVQKEMGTYMKTWVDGMKHEDKAYVLRALEKDSVRNGKNKRRGAKEDQIGHGAGGQYQSFLPPPSELLGKVGQQIPGFNQAQTFFQQHGGGTGRDVGGFAPPPGPPPRGFDAPSMPPSHSHSGYGQQTFRPPSPNGYGGSPVTSFSPPVTNVGGFAPPSGPPGPPGPPSGMPDASSYGGFPNTQVFGGYNPSYYGQQQQQGGQGGKPWY